MTDAGKKIEVGSLKVPELKLILKRKGIPYTEKRKEELVLLVERAEGLYDDLEADDQGESERKRRCVSVSDGAGVVTDVQLSGRIVTWTEDLKCMPVVRDGNVFAYLMHQCKWEWDRVNSFQNDDGYKMFKDQHVEKMKVGRINEHDEHVYVEGSVKPEQRQTDSRYNTWILLSKESKVESAGCQCVAA